MKMVFLLLHVIYIFEPTKLVKIKFSDKRTHRPKQIWPKNLRPNKSGRRRLDKKTPIRENFT